MRTFSFALLGLGLTAGLASVGRAGLIFTKIVDSSDGLSNFSLPSVNSSSTVAFRADDGSSTGIFTGNGAVLIPALLGSHGSVFGAPAINDLNQIAYDGIGMLGQFPEPAVFGLTGGSSTQIYAFGEFANSPETPFVAINNLGTVFFASAAPFPTHTIFGSGNGGPITFYLHDSPNANGNGIPTQVTANQIGQGALSYGNLGAAAINVNGNTVVSSQMTVYNGDLGPGALDLFSDASIDSHGNVVFGARYGGAEKLLFLLSNGQLHQIAMGDWEPAINDAGVVAGLSSNTSILAGVGAPSDPVISDGDPLDRSTVTALGFSPLGFSNGGQLAFYAELADGRKGIYETTVPEPSTISFLACIALTARRRRAASAPQ